ncbi:MAG TPA: sigma 54-interacting transcriptional regulator, partial [Terriglobales bacterium]|nr:sigma 54-interacting transcriptional regulator [Terriglobales bacterium]
MNRAAARPQPVLPAVAIVTTDELVGPEAATYLDSAYQLQMLQTWDELQAMLQEVSLDAILLDLDTLGESSDVGVAAMRELRSNHPDLVLVAMTRSNSRHLRWKAMEATADEYFVAPIEFQEVQIILARALEKRLAEIEYRSRKDKEVPQPSFCGLIGLSEPMQRVYEAIRRVAGSTSTVLIRGESGTGKELVARAIVSMSPRAEKPFISLNCAALPDNLIEAELFGHEKG